MKLVQQPCDGVVCALKPAICVAAIVMPWTRGPHTFPYALIFKKQQNSFEYKRLCKILGFYGGDYEECRLLGYKNRVRTSQETHHVSATESNQLMLCKIWGLHGGDYEEWRPQECYAVWLL
jgi:hypothetical protein